MLYHVKLTRVHGFSSWQRFDIRTETLGRCCIEESENKKTLKKLAVVFCLSYPPESFDSLFSNTKIHTK